MARDILGEYGPEKSTGPSSKPGGVMSTRDVFRYATPQGPTNINDPKGPGIHGHNCGTGQKPTSNETSGSVGLHGSNKGQGSQR